MCKYLSIGKWNQQTNVLSESFFRSHQQLRPELSSCLESSFSIMPQEMPNIPNEGRSPLMTRGSSSLVLGSTGARFGNVSVVSVPASTSTSASAAPVYSPQGPNPWFGEWRGRRTRATGVGSWVCDSVELEVKSFRRRCPNWRLIYSKRGKRLKYVFHPCATLTSDSIGCYGSVSLSH